MKVAIPVWNGNVSPVLDTAEKLAVFDINGGKVISRDEVSTKGKGIHEKARIMAENAKILLCGAISVQMASYLSSYGLEVYPWIMGNAEQLIEMVIAGNVPGPEYSMPGCRRRHCGHRIGRKRQGHLSDKTFRNFKNVRGRDDI